MINHISSDLNCHIIFTDLSSKRRNHLMNYPLRINYTNFLMCRLQGQSKIKKIEIDSNIKTLLSKIHSQRERFITFTHLLRAKSNPHPCTKSFYKNIQKPSISNRKEIHKIESFN